MEFFPHSNFILLRNIEAAKETMSSLKENGFKVNYYTLGALLSHYAKVGDLENIEKTFDLFKEEGIELLNRDIFKTICELAVNGHADKIDALLPHLQPNIELKRSLQNAVTLFVESKQSALVPKIVQLSAGDAKSIYRHLLREMLRLSSPESELKETIDRIEATGFTIEENFDIFRPALECSSEEIIRKLLAHMKDKSIEVSESTFEKLFRLSAEKGIKEVLDVVNLMCAEFKIQPRISFIRDVILPGLKVKENPALAFAKLQTTSIQLRKVTLAIINGLLNEGDIKTAYDFACSNQCFYGVELVERPLSRAYATTGDVSNFVSFVRLIYKSFDKINFYYNDKKLTNEEIQSKQKAFVGRILFEAIKHRQSETNSHTNLLNAFAEEGLTISAEDAEKILKHLKIDSDTQIGRVLQKLSTEQLELKPIKEQTNLKQMKILNQLSSADVQNILEVKLAQGHNAAATEKLLFLAYIREGNISEIESLIASNKFSISNSDYALLIELYTRTGNLENALNMLKRVCANNSSFKLDRIKVAKLVTLMVERDRSFDEIETLLMAHRQGKAEFRIFIFEHLLDKLAANAQSKMVDQLFDALVKHNYIEPTVESTGPMITSRLKSGAYAEAVDKFEQIAETYKLVPMSMVLFIHLIRSNEIDLLQRAFDIYEKVRGENSALRQLAFAFVECGQERQAKAIFENERLKNISKNIESECRKYVEHGKIESAKTLLKATKGIFCDRHVIYRTILDIYHKENKAQEALDLWVEYTTDGILPNQAFKTKLAVLLKANNMEIPFDLESKTTHKPNVDKEVVTN